MTPTRARLSSALVLLLSTCLSAACGGGGGGGGGGDDAPAAQLAAPQGVHVAPAPGEPSTVELRWSAPAPAPTLAGGDGGALFRVFRAPVPVTEENVQLVISFLVEGTAATVTLPRGGLQHLRVAAVDGEGRLGALSEELVIDTSERLYYRAVDTFGTSLWSVRPDGSELTKLSGDTEVAGGDHFVSPLGDRIAWKATRPGSAVETVFVAPTDGSGAPVELVPATDQPSLLQIDGFSPDGRRLTYQAALDGTTARRAFLARTDGAGSGAPVGADGWRTIGRTGFTLDGTELLVPLKSLADGDSGLFAHAVDDPDAARRLTPEEGLAARIPGSAPFAISPDGTRLAWIAFEELGADERRQRLFVADLAGGEPAELDDPFLSFPGQNLETWGIESFVWSPDGALFACLYAHHDGTEVIWLVPADGASAGWAVPTFTSAGNQVGPPQFTPDSRRVVFTEVSGTSQLRIADVVPGAPVTALTVTMTSGAGVTQHFLSPDGSRVIYLAGSVTGNSTELLTVDLAVPGSAALLHSPGNGAHVRTPTFSPDGESVAFAVGPAGLVGPADASEAARELVGDPTGQTLLRITWPGLTEQR